MGYKLCSFNIYYLINSNSLAIFNCLTKAFSVYINISLCRYNKEYYFEINSINKLTFESMIKNGFIIPYELNEQALLSRIYFNKNRKYAIPGVLLLLTMECNFACPYCYEQFDKYTTYKNYRCIKGNLEDNIFILIEKIVQKKYKYFSLFFFGGEPLLEKKRLFHYADKVQKICGKYNVELLISITTNGYLLDAPFVDALASKYRIRQIFITLDGPPEVHNKRRMLKNGRGTFDVIWNNILYAVNRLPPKSITIGVNIDETNLPFVNDLEDIIRDAGIEEKVYVSKRKLFLEKEKCVRDKSMCQLSELTEREFLSLMKLKNNETPVLLSDHDVTIDKLEYTPCIARGEFYTIDLNGNINKCLAQAGTDFNVGNIENNITLYNENLLKYTVYEPWKSLPCSNCPAIPLYFGGCIKARIFDNDNKSCSHKIDLVKDYIITQVKEVCKQKNLCLNNAKFINLKLLSGL